MTRTEAAAKIAELLEAAEYSASTWSPEGDAGPVRVYVTIPAASYKKRARKIGHVSIKKDGSISGDNLEVQRGSILGLIPDLAVEAVTPKPVAAPQAAAPATDDDVAAFERSERAVAAAEAAREQG